MKKITLALAALSIAALSACGIPVSDECTKAIACSAHYDEINGTSTDAETTYGAESTCWTNAETADACTTSCETLTTSYRDALTTAEEEVGDCAE